MLEDKMEFELHIAVDNDAYHTQHVQYQLIDNLKDIIAKLEEGCSWGIVRDVNGNQVGDWDIE
jgi:hypothetical protein